MNRYFAPWALLPGGWARDVRFEVDAEGMLAAVVPGSPREAATLLDGAVVPGMPNAHSHVAQRALAGLTERAAPQGRDSFWTWREAMYEFVERLDPETFEALAAGAYAEMLETGYTSVAEFHYLHHDAGGTPYANPAEMSERVAAAAATAGIALTLVPALYRYSGAGGEAPLPRQRRFVHTRDSFVALWQQLASRIAGEPGVRLGLGFHSLRAVEPEDIAALVSLADTATPIHIHVSEQQGEVEAVEARHGATPIDLLARTIELDARWALIHATHASETELAKIAARKAVVVVCPTTEANLGDGIFPAERFRTLGGRITLGSDSNVTIDVAEELRWLEYVQRLAESRRHVLGTAGSPSLGDALYAEVARAGAQALAQRAGALAAGSRADLIVLAPPEAETPSLDTYVFRSAAWRVREVLVAGRTVVRGGVHVERERLRSRAAAARRALG